MKNVKKWICPKSRLRRQIQMISSWIVDDATPRHTPECLAKRLVELEPMLLNRFPAVAADCGLDAALWAGLRYIERVQAGQAVELRDGRAWLFRVAWRAALRCIKRELPCVSIDFAIPAVSSRAPIAESLCDATDVHTALEELPARQKEAVFLRVMLGLSLRDAAREMSVAPQTLERYLKKAFARLKKNLSAVTKKKASTGAGAFASL
jgi:RNA polymerase sigma factor (sigma-70 family)